ncbi:hypothetical protein SFRURICE_006188 [Spodoptera frugiperda]|nr:hypothetical protein SFRURICE_006188 [Spodoptera frugiperda]
MLDLVRNLDRSDDDDDSGCPSNKVNTDRSLKSIVPEFVNGGAKQKLMLMSTVVINVQSASTYRSYRDGTKKDTAAQYIVAGDVPPQPMFMNDDDPEMSLMFGDSYRRLSQTENTGPDLTGIRQMLDLVRNLDRDDDDEDSGCFGDQLNTDRSLNSNVPEFVLNGGTKTEISVNGVVQSASVYVETKEQTCHCSIVSEENGELNNSIKRGGNNIHTLYQNVRGMRTKTTHFLSWLASSSFDIFSITESGLNEGIHDAEHGCDRADRQTEKENLLFGGLTYHKLLCHILSWLLAGLQIGRLFSVSAAKTPCKSAHCLLLLYCGVNAAYPIYYNYSDAATKRCQRGVYAAQSVVSFEETKKNVAIATLLRVYADNDISSKPDVKLWTPEQFERTKGVSLDVKVEKSNAVDHVTPKERALPSTPTDSTRRQIALRGTTRQNPYRTIAKVNRKYAADLGKQYRAHCERKQKHTELNINWD